MGKSLGRVYQIHEFAKLAGLTVRALHHYDRLGLLTPPRNRAGHRTYSDKDLEALAQILALKSVGVPLAQISALGRTDVTGLAEALRLQRAALERRKPVMKRAIWAIRNVELAIERGADASPAVLKQLIETIGPGAARAGRTAKPARRAPLEGPGQTLRPSPERCDLRKDWSDLLADAEASLDAEPSGAEAQMLARRVLGLMNLVTGGDAVDHSLRRSAHLLGEGTPGELDSTVSPAERAWDLIGRALAACVTSPGAA